VIPMEDYKIEFWICPEDFKQTFGRPPQSDEEFEEFCTYCEKGLTNGHIDWDIVFECAKEAMEQCPETDQSGIAARCES
jgi:hypothetical protein